MQVLYGLDTQGADWPDGPRQIAAAVARHYSMVAPDATAPDAGTPEAHAQCEALVSRVIGDRQAIDRAIQQAAANWKLDRMNRVDRNVLRVAACELMFGENVPPRVVLDEAIEIAKSFGSNASASFVNGVLDRVLKDLQG